MVVNDGCWCLIKIPRWPLARFHLVGCCCFATLSKITCCKQRSFFLGLLSVQHGLALWFLHVHWMLIRWLGDAAAWHLYPPEYNIIQRPSSTRGLHITTLHEETCRQHIVEPAGLRFLVIMGVDDQQTSKINQELVRMGCKFPIQLTIKHEEPWLHQINQHKQWSINNVWQLLTMGSLAIQVAMSHHEPSSIIIINHD